MDTKSSDPLDTTSDVITTTLTDDLPDDLTNDLASLDSIIDSITASSTILNSTPVGITDNTDHNVDEPPNQNYPIVPGSMYDKILGMIYGHALGDACGLVTEFCFKNKLAAVRFPYTDPIRGLPVCDWTNETDHMILIIQSITQNVEKFDAIDVANRLKFWHDNGFVELGDAKPTFSGAMKSIIADPNFTVDPRKVAADLWEKSKNTYAANNSLTRTSIVGVLPVGVAEYAANLSAVTHADPRCAAACVMQSSIIHNMIYRGVATADDVDMLLQNSSEKARKLSNDTELSRYVQTAYTQCVADLKLDDTRYVNYVYKCLSCAIYALQVVKVALKHNKQPNFKKFINKIIEECGDADANGAVAGAVMGAYLGYTNLPQDWVAELPNAPWLNGIVHEFMQSMGPYISANI
jgi:ADP-ribosylglycohydrolase